MTQEMMAKECGVARETLYRWRTDNEEFKEALSKATRERWKAAEQLAVTTMINLMSEGNYQATKYVLDSMDYSGTQKIDANVTGTQNIVITIGDDEEEE
jgi:DNA-binding XRE family transcriptional regulator